MSQDGPTSATTPQSETHGANNDVKPTAPGDGESHEEQPEGNERNADEHTDLCKLLQDVDSDDEGIRKLGERREDWKHLVNTPCFSCLENTPLHVVAERGYLKMANQLLGAGADINSQNSYGRQPLHLACANENDDLVERLSRVKGYKAKPDSIGWYPIHEAMYANLATETVLSLLESDNSMIEERNGWGMTPLNLAVLRGKEAVVQALLRKGAKIDTQHRNGWTPLIMALIVKHYSIFNSLISHLQVEGDTAVLDRQDDEGKTALIHLCSNISPDTSESIRKILALNPRIDIIDHEGRTALHYAMRSVANIQDWKVAMQMVDLVDEETLLLEDNEGNTAIDYAVYEDDSIKNSDGPLVTRICRLGVDRRNEVLSRLALRMERHDFAKRVMSEMPQDISIDNSLQVNLWDLGEWAIYHRLPKVLVNYISALRQDQRDNHGKDHQKKLKKVGDIGKQIIEKLKNECKERHDRNLKKPTDVRKQIRTSSNFQSLKLEWRHMLALYIGHNVEEFPSDYYNRFDESGEPGTRDGDENQGLQELNDMEDIIDCFFVERVPRPSESRDAAVCTESMIESMKHFHAAAIQIHRHDKEVTRFGKFRTVQEVVYGTGHLETFEETIEKFSRLGLISNDALKSTSGFTWIHLPSTNVCLSIYTRPFLLSC